MKNRVLIADLAGKLDQDVIIAGWLHRLRDLSKFGFAIIRDRSGLVQVVLTIEQLDQLRGLQVESVLKVAGHVVKKISKDPNVNEVEIHATQIEIYSPVTDILPVEINHDDLNLQLETLIDNRVVTLRHPKVRAIFKVQAALIQGYREYMHGQGFTEITFPILAGAASEGGAEFFSVNYFDRLATLTQSAQLYKQIMVGVYEGVYGLSYSFRAEKYATSRHLTEFNQFEFELGFVEKQEEIMQHAEGALRHMLSRVEKDCSAELALLKVTLPQFGKKFPSLTLKSALELYRDEVGVDETAEPDLSPAAEKWLTMEWAPKNHQSNFVFITAYPATKRPFYAKLDAKDHSLTETFDLIGYGSEIISGGMRVNQYAEQIQRLKDKGLNPDDFTDYLMMHKFGIPPEGGFGLGLQRLTQNILSLANIKEATLFPRDVQRLRP